MCTCVILSLLRLDINIARTTVDILKIIDNRQSFKIVPRLDKTRQDTHARHGSAVARVHMAPSFSSLTSS